MVPLGNRVHNYHGKKKTWKQENWHGTGALV